AARGRAASSPGRSGSASACQAASRSGRRSGTSHSSRAEAPPLPGLSGGVRGQAPDEPELDASGMSSTNDRSRSRATARSCANRPSAASRSRNGAGTATPIAAAYYSSASPQGERRGLPAPGSAPVIERARGSRPPPRDDRLVAAPKDMPGLLVPVIEHLRVKAVQAVDSLGEVRLRGADEQVIVRSHQTVGLARPLE